MCDPAFEIRRSVTPHDDAGATPPVYNPSVIAELAGLIAHEINQPLSGILSSAGAGLRWLKRDTPDLAEVESNLLDIRKSVQRADAIIRELRALVDHIDVPGGGACLDGFVAAVSNRTFTDTPGDRAPAEPVVPISA